MTMQSKAIDEEYLLGKEIISENGKAKIISISETEWGDLVFFVTMLEGGEIKKVSATDCAIIKY